MPHCPPCPCARPSSITFLRVPQGGFGILEEMCVNYVHYYPQSQLELCKSAVDPGFLHRYFNLVNRYRAPAHLAGQGAPVQKPNSGV